jgi:hypothetical protein
VRNHLSTSERKREEKEEDGRPTDHPPVAVVGWGEAIEDPVPKAGGLSDNELWTLLRAVALKARDDLRRVLIRDRADREAISSRLMRYRDQNGQDWADMIDFLTMWPDARRQAVRFSGE